MMDLATTAHQAAEYLSPYLPALLAIGSGAAKKVGENLVGVASEQANAIWAAIKLRAHELRPALLEAAEDVAKDPADAQARTVLEVQLRKLLEAQPALHTELGNILSPIAIQQNTVTASGAGSIASSGDISGSSLSTNVSL